MFGGRRAGGSASLATAPFARSFQISESAAATSFHASPGSESIAMVTPPAGRTATPANEVSFHPHARPITGTTRPPRARAPSASDQRASSAIRSGVSSATIAPALATFSSSNVSGSPPWIRPSCHTSAPRARAHGARCFARRSRRRTSSSTSAARITIRFDPSPPVLTVPRIHDLTAPFVAIFRVISPSRCRLPPSTSPRSRWDGFRDAVRTLHVDGGPLPRPPIWLFRDRSTNLPPLHGSR